jgi:predicted CoA-substrate-specific enzyme activase
MFTVGIDIGSTITKIVIMNQTEILVSVATPTGAEHRRLGHKVMSDALRGCGLSFDAIDYIVATGYGRINVPFADQQITEITCHMRGVHWLVPGVRTIIDIGGQDSKGIKIKDDKLVDFVMNDKCAAGTGRFFEVIADALGVKLEEIGEMSLRSENPAEISSLCTVFAEQEAMLRLSEGSSVEDIMAGLHKAVASRIHGMVAKMGIEREVVITGGGAMNLGLVKAFERRFGLPVVVPPEPLITGALGAALIARETSVALGPENVKERKEKRRVETITFFGEGS